VWAARFSFFMVTTFIITTHWWADTALQPAWNLLTNSDAWPRWWRAVARAQGSGHGGRAARGTSGWPWRTMLGLPLHLGVAALAAQPPGWMTLRVQGDLQGQATFTLQPAAGTGIDLSCRWELGGPLARQGVRGWLLKRRVERLLQSLAQDMGHALDCRVHQLGVWQGSSRREA
jgi:hypothetical protein